MFKLLCNATDMFTTSTQPTVSINNEFITLSLFTIQLRSNLTNVFVWQYYFKVHYTGMKLDIKNGTFKTFSVCLNIKRIVGSKEFLNR